MIVINGVSYTLVPIPTGVPSVAPSLAPNADADVALGYDFEICTGIAICSEPRAPVNWDQHTKSVDLNQVPLTPGTYPTSRVPIGHWQIPPFSLAPAQTSTSCLSDLISRRSARFLLIP